MVTNLCIGGLSQSRCSRYCWAAAFEPGLHGVTWWLTIGRSKSLHFTWNHRRGCVLILSGSQRLLTGDAVVWRFVNPQMLLCALRCPLKCFNRAVLWRPDLLVTGASHWQMTRWCFYGQAHNHTGGLGVDEGQLRWFELICRLHNVLNYTAKRPYSFWMVQIK